MTDTCSLFPTIPSHVLVIADRARPWMMHGQRGTRIRLNAPALTLLRACNGEHTIAELIEIEVRRCGLPAERVAGDVLRWLEGLQAADMLELRPERRRFPLESMVLELTNRCNLTCRHCIYGHRVDPALRAYLPLTLIERVVAEAVTIGGREVYLTGGEPSLHPDFLAVVEICKTQGLRVVIQTNGVHLTNAAIDRLRQLGVDEVRISLDGVTPETNDAIRGKGTFARAAATLRRLQAAGLPVAVSFTACKINQSEWERLGELCEALETDTLYSGEVVLCGRAAEHARELVLSARESYPFPRIVLCLMAHTIGRRPFATCVCGEVRTDGRVSGVAGRSKCTVLHNGDLLACSLFDQPEMVAGNLHHASLRDLWENAPVFRQLRSISVLQFERCATCTYQYICGGGCRAKTYILRDNLCGLPCPLDCSWRRMLLADMTALPELRGKSLRAARTSLTAEARAESS